MAKRRRAPGEGSLFQRADGRWCAVLDVPSTDGKRRQKRVTRKTYRDAVAALAELKRDLDAGFVLSGSTTVGAWLATWITDIHRDEVRPSTRQSYEVVIRQIGTTAITAKKLSALTPEDVRGMLRELGSGRRRTQKAYILLQSALRDAEREGLVRRNVCTAVNKPKVTTAARKAFTAGEARAIIGHAANHRDTMAATRWAMAFLTGLRQGELLGLQWDRVDLSLGAIDVAWQLQTLTRSHGCGDETPAGWPCSKLKAAYCSAPRWQIPPDFELVELYRSLVLTRPKSQAGARFVPLLPPLVAALTQLRAEDVGPNPHGLVFHMPDGRPLAPKEDWEAWQTLLRDAGIAAEGETIPLHCARHTAATLMRAAGIDEQTRQELLGHASTEATRIYSHADSDSHRRAMAALAELAPGE
jgi:integrase